MLRKAFPTDAIRRFVTSEEEFHAIRARLVDNFLLRHDRGWYSLEKVAREVGAGFLGRTAQKLKAAHSVAGDFYSRHFRARRMVGGGGRLGGDFVEARFHLVLAGRQDELREIVSAFERHIRAEINLTSPVPTDPREIDERIAVLSALLGEEGAKGLEYHLARCLSARGRGADAERALTHVRRALGPQAPAEAWVLAGRLASQVEGWDSGVAVLRQGLRIVQPAGNLFALYRSCAELMADANRTEEAIDLLREGITKVPAEFSLVSLYRLCAELLTRAGRPDEGIDLVREGIATVPAQFNLVSLYQACAELMAGAKRTGEAIDLLQEGITKVPAEFSLVSLYRLCAELMAGAKRTGEAIDLLREGTRKVPPRFNGYRLAEAAFYLAASLGYREVIQGLVTTGGELALRAEQKALGNALLLQLDGEWTRAAEQAGQGIEHRPTIPLCLVQAFSWLAAGRAEEAQNALNRFPRPIEHGKGSPVTWLASFVALRCGRPGDARQLFTLYVGKDEQVPETLTEIDLLGCWNGPVPLSTPHPAYYWSTLPPSITGLEHSVRRAPPFESVPEIAARISQAASSDTTVTPSETGKRQADPRAAASHDIGELRILVLATEWASRHGGLSTFNRFLCGALAQAGAQVVCAVPSANASEVAEAGKARVDLFLAPGHPGSDQFVGLLRRLNLPNGFVPNAVVGHGRITGFAAQAQVADFYPEARRIHFVHTAPGEIEFYKGKRDAAATAEERERMEVSLAEGASLVVAVGPRLAREAGTSLRPFGRLPLYIDWTRPALPRQTEPRPQGSTASSWVALRTSN